MNRRFPPQAEPPPLDMTLDGQFREPPATPIVARIGRAAIIVAVLAGAGAAALLALWFALALIPIAIGAGLIGWGAFRFQRWRAHTGYRGFPPRSGPFGR